MNKEIDFKGTFENVIVFVLIIINELLYLLFFPTIGFILFYLDFFTYIITPVFIILSIIFCIIWIAVLIAQDSPTDRKTLGFHFTELLLTSIIEYKEQEKETTRIHSPSGWKDD